MDKQRLLCEASRWGKLDMVKQLVEKYGVDPIGKSNDYSSEKKNQWHLKLKIA